MSIEERKNNLKMRLEANLHEVQKHEFAINCLLKDMADIKRDLFRLSFGSSIKNLRVNWDRPGLYGISGVLPEHPNKSISGRSFYLRLPSPKPLGDMTFESEQEMLRGALERIARTIKQFEAQLAYLDQVFDECDKLLDDFLDKLFALPGTHVRSEPTMLGEAIYEYVLHMVRLENRE